MTPDRTCAACGRRIVAPALAVRPIDPRPNPGWHTVFICDRACLRTYNNGRTDA